MNEELEEKRKEEKMSKDYKRSIVIAWAIMILILLIPAMIRAFLFIKFFIISNY